MTLNRTGCDPQPYTHRRFNGPGRRSSRNRCACHAGGGLFLMSEAPLYQLCARISCLLCIRVSSLSLPQAPGLRWKLASECTARISGLLCGRVILAALHENHSCSTPTPALAAQRGTKKKSSQNAKEEEFPKRVGCGV